MLININGNQAIDTETEQIYETRGFYDESL